MFPRPAPFAAALAASFACAACGESGAVAAPPKTSTADTATHDIAADVAAVPDAGVADFGQPCSQDSDCQSGTCSWSFAGRVCTQPCSVATDCPTGWACRASVVGGKTLCAPRDALLCAPCAKDADCGLFGDPDARCIAAGTAGSYCATACGGAEGCPSGYTCDATASAGHCRPAGGAVCACPAYAKQQALATACVSANALGKCSGFRACGPGGLGPCDAMPAAAESCNGKDDDCDGQTDEAFNWHDLAGGTPVAVGQACGVGTCSGGSVVCSNSTTAVCTTANNVKPETCNGQDDDCDGQIDDGVCACKADIDCAPQQDGKLCNGSLYCNPATKSCELNPASVVTCSPATQPCQVATCVEPTAPATTASCKTMAAPDGTPCDDGKASTVGEVCTAGVCGQGVQVVPCTVTADCAKYEDGSLCNGTLFCNKAVKACQVNPATVVVCPSGNDTLCSKNTCGPATGACAMVPTNQGKPCDDGFACTAGEACDQGSCTAAANTCKCAKDSDCAASEDGNLCNGTLFCDKAKAACVVNPATVVACSASKDTPCSVNACVAKTGQCALQPKPDGTACDADGSACTPADTCSAGSCKADTNTCTCKSDADCTAKEDGNLCNGTLFCDKAAGICIVNPATAVQCSKAQDSVCQQSACNPVDGQCGPVALPLGTTCSAGDACLSPGLCGMGGACLPGIKKSCTDANPCTQDVCDGAVGCVHAPVAATCSDGDACTAGDGCVDSVCKPGKALGCDDGNPCTDDACAKAKGCTALPNAANCSDGDVCTVADGCVGGVCVAGVALNCDDKDPCTTDSCAKASGCKHAALSGCLPCANNNACQDGNVCTAEFCVSGLCQFAAVDATGCDDGNPCTSGDNCAKSVCQAGGPKVCNDGDACTADACDPKTGCTTTPLPACDDNNPCTDDSCAKQTGCQYAANSKACDVDGNPCTADLCAASKCTAAGPKLCDDGNPCTDGGCDPKIGCTAVANSKACNDGNPCTSGESCKAGACGGPTTPTDCDDKLGCTADSCDPSKGCLHDGSKSDGAVCAELPNGVCKAGACQCGAGYSEVAIDVGGTKAKACEATGPVWGKRADKPIGVYAVQDVAGSKVVQDSQTKLVWQQGAAPIIKDLPGAKAYCDGLVIGALQDWRVPSAHELATVVDFSVELPGPAIDAAFVGTKAEAYWSSTLVQGDPANAWGAHFDTGRLQYYETKGLNETRCVRGGGVQATGGRYKLSAEGGVASDQWTQLHWQRQSTGGQMTWQAAKTHCAGLGLEGGVWRLPTVRELHGLVSFGPDVPAIDQATFPGTAQAQYWTSTPRAGSSIDVWTVLFSGGAMVYASGSLSRYVRCVRD